jgi:hypothetical protein
LPTASEPPAFGEFELDLPAMAADLPAARLKSPPPKPRPAAPVDLPDLAADLPVRAGGPAGLPAVAAHLPSVVAGLPVVTGALPMNAAALPNHQPSLPVVLDSLPAARRFGDLDLPTHAESLPSVPPLERHLPAPAPETDLGAFGEIDLPREPPPSSQSPLRAAALSPGAEEFGGLDLGTASPPSPRGARGAGRRRHGLRRGRLRQRVECRRRGRRGGCTPRRRRIRAPGRA